MRVVNAWIRLRGLGQGTPSPAFGATLMLVACGLLAAGDACTKALVQGLPTYEIVALRGLAGLIMAVLAAPMLGGFVQLRPRSMSNVSILTVLLLASLFLFPLCLRYLPLADAIMLAYLSPLVVAMLSPWLLSEQVGWRRWGAVVVGLIGAAFVVQPGAGALHPAVVIPMIVAVLVAVRDILTRRYIRGESALAIVAAVNLGAVVVGVATIPMGWTMPTGFEWSLIVLAGALLTSAQFMMAAAFRHADASVISCLKYVSIAYAAALGWVFWGEALGVFDWIGAALIAISGIVITLRTKPA